MKFSSNKVSAMINHKYLNESSEGEAISLSYINKLTKSHLKRKRVYKQFYFLFAMITLHISNSLNNINNVVVTFRNNYLIFALKYK